MPTQAKVLSEEEEKLHMTQVEEFSPEYLQDFGNQEELDQILFRLMQPHAYTARSEFEKRKSQQEQRKKWLDTILNNQTALHMTQDKVRQLADATRNQNNKTGNQSGGSGGFTPGR